MDGIKPSLSFLGKCQAPCTKDFPGIRAAVAGWAVCAVAGSLSLSGVWKFCRGHGKEFIYPICAQRYEVFREESAAWWMKQPWHRSLPAVWTHTVRQNHDSVPGEVAQCIKIRAGKCWAKFWLFLTQGQKDNYMNTCLNLCKGLIW